MVFEKTACTRMDNKCHQIYVQRTPSFVTLDGKLSQPFSITFGVHQGSILSPILFNIVMKAIHQNIETKALKVILRFHLC